MYDPKLFLSVRDVRALTMITDLYVLEPNSHFTEKKSVDRICKCNDVVQPVNLLSTELVDAESRSSI